MAKLSRTMNMLGHLARPHDDRRDEHEDRLGDLEGE